MVGEREGLFDLRLLSFIEGCQVRNLKQNPWRKAACWLVSHDWDLSINH